MNEVGGSNHDGVAAVKLQCSLYRQRLEHSSFNICAGEKGLIKVAVRNF